MDYGVARQRDPTCIDVGAAIAVAIAGDVDEESLFAAAVTRIFAVFAVIAAVANGVVQRIIGIGGVAFGTGFITIAIGEMEDVPAVSVWFGFAFVGSHGLRLGAIGCNWGWERGSCGCGLELGVRSWKIGGLVWEGVVVFGPGEAGPAAAVVGILEASQIADEVMQTFGAFFATEFLEGVDVGDHFGNGDAGEVFEEVAGFGFFESAAGFADAVDAGFADLIGLPIEKASVSPVGKVGFGDGLVIELSGDEFLDFGQAV